MLAECQVHTTIPVTDMERAARWYEEKLGLKRGRSMPGGIQFRMADDTAFLLYPTTNAGQAPQTIMAFVTNDLDSEMRTLKDRGIRFEEYDMPGLRTVDSVATIDDTRSAWFKDIDGNILAVVEMPL